MAQHGLGLLLRAVVWRATVLTLLWGVLANNTGWYFGAVMIMVSTIASLIFSPPRSLRWSLMGLGWFLSYFLKKSLRGGIDVAFRALHPALPLKPGWLNYPLRLPEGPARVLFASTISLLPGTLSTRWDGNNLIIHVLVKGPHIEPELVRMEERIAALFAMNLTSAEETHHD